MKKKALFVLAHPHLNQSVANRTIVEHLNGLNNITLHNIYDQYPYFHIDVKKEQQLLKEHDLIVLQHPFFWFNMPPLLKLWFDEVLSVGFAYGPNGDQLKNKKMLLSITAGGDQLASTEQCKNLIEVESFLKSYQYTCNLCQIEWLKPHVLFGSRKTSTEEIQAHANILKSNIMRELGAS